MNRMLGGGRRCRAGSKTVCCWVMNPQVRALTETKGNGPVLRRGKNTGVGRGSCATYNI